MTRASGSVALIAALFFSTLALPALADPKTLPEDSFFTTLKAVATSGNPAIMTASAGSSAGAALANYLASPEGMAAVAAGEAYDPDLSQVLQSSDPRPCFSRYLAAVEKAGADKITYDTTGIGSVDGFSQKVAAVDGKYRLFSALMNSLSAQIVGMAASPSIAPGDIAMSDLVLSTIKDRLQGVSDQAQALVSQGKALPASVRAKLSSNPVSAMKVPGIEAGIQAGVKEAQAVVSGTPALASMAVDLLGKLKDLASRGVSLNLSSPPTSGIIDLSGAPAGLPSLTGPPAAGLGIGIATLRGVTRVTRIDAGGLAQEAGLRVGDVILRIDGRPSGSSHGLVLAHLSRPSGKVARLMVERPGHDQPLYLHLRRP